MDRKQSGNGESGALASQELWHRRAAEHQRVEHEPRKGLRGLFDRARLRVGAEVDSSVGLHESRTLLRNILPARKDFSVLEVGCAPGGHLLWLNKCFGYLPFGIEFTENGVEATRAAFRQKGLPPENIIHGDFFSSEFQSSYRGCFDVVFSWAFIEHFDDPRSVLRCQVDLLKPNGYLVCMIPNLRGFNMPILKLLCRAHLKFHNCDIMDRRAFEMLFKDVSIQTLFCGPIRGVTVWGISSLRQSGPARAVLAGLLDRVQDALAHITFLVNGGRAILPVTSSYLFVGQCTG